MQIQNRLFALIFRLMIVAFVIAGITIQFLAGNIDKTLCFFTIQTNIFIGVLMLVLSIFEIRQLCKKGIKGTPFNFKNYIHYLSSCISL